MLAPLHDPAIARATDRIRAASAAGTPLAIAGGGTKGFYGPAPRGEPLSTRDIAGIVAYEPSELVVTARAGTPLAELEAALAERGQCLAFEPPHFGDAATVGGMVSAGLAGPARASAGAVRDFVLGAHLLNGRGEHLAFGGQVMKNVAGYDVSRVLAGAWGTLGVLTQVSLKVLPVAPAETTLRFAGWTEAEAIARLNRWGGLPLPLNASCWLVDAGTPTLYLRLRGAAAAVQAAVAQLAAEGGVPQDGAAADWALCREQRLPWFEAGAAAGRGLWRASVPPATPPLAVAGAEPPLVEWHGGQRWYFAPDGDADFGQRLRAAAVAAGGHAMLFRAARAVWERAAGRFDAFFTPLGSAEAAIQQRLRAAFDPAGIFNPGRMG